MRASKVSAILLRGMLKVALLVGIVHFRPKTTERGRMVMESYFHHRSWRMWLSVTFRLMALIVFLYVYLRWLVEVRDLVHLLLHCSYLGISVPCYLWIIGLQHFHGNAVIEVVNKILRLFSQVRALPLQRNTGIGGKRELVFIVLALLSHVAELVLFYLRQFMKEKIIEWFFLYYVSMLGQVIMRINIVWYLNVGVLYAKVNEYASLQMRNMRNPQGYQILEETVRLYRDIYEMVCSFQDMFNLCLSLSLMQNLLHFAVFSYEIIIDFALCDLVMWSIFTKILYDLLLISLAVEGAGNQFKGIRQILSELCCFEEHKDLQRLVDGFATQLNLYPFRVRLFGVCDISMNIFLKVISGVICYLIFVIQCALEIKRT
ncbi:hypothetical protein KR038_009239 [Drosophila bunnanda]|nr:hypothetical protein KR038_009239 [Drosophila bunnanda]